MKAFEPGSGNTYTYHRDPDPIDNQAEVKVYRLNPDGSKGEFLRTMPAYPEGGEERRFVPGSGGKKKEKEEDDSKMARVRKDKEKIMAKARPMLAEGLSIKKTAKELDVPTTTLFQWIKKEEEQTLPPEPDQAANQEPERETAEPAEDIIPYSVERLENIGKDIPPIKMPIGCSLPIEDTTELQDKEMAKRDTGPKSGIAIQLLLGAEETANHQMINMSPKEKELLETTLNAYFAVKRVLNNPVALAQMKQVLESGVV